MLTPGGPKKRELAARKRIEFLEAYEKAKRLERRDKKKAEFEKHWLTQNEIRQLLDELINSIISN